MNAMLEPRIVAASTQRWAVLGHGEADAIERMEASAQGSWITVAMEEKKPKS
jgi:pyrimidine deaminase RibD-like protein